MSEINSIPTNKILNSKIPQIIDCNKKSFDEDLFVIEMKDEILFPISTVEDRVKEFVDHVSKACDASMYRKQQDTHHNLVYWWNETISQCRKKCLCARRLHQRARKCSRETASSLSFNYEMKRRKLRKVILSSKRSCWKELCNEVIQDS